AVFVIAGRGDAFSVAREAGLDAAGPFRLIAAHFDDVILDEGDGELRLVDRGAIEAEQRLASVYRLEAAVGDLERAVVREERRDRFALPSRDVPAVARGQFLNLIAILEFLDALFEVLAMGFSPLPEDGVPGAIAHRPPSSSTKRRIGSGAGRLYIEVNAGSSCGTKSASPG